MPHPFYTSCSLIRCVVVGMVLYATRISYAQQPATTERLPENGARVSLAQTPQKQVKLTWTLDATVSQAAKGIAIERGKGLDGTMERVSPVLAKSDTSWTDTAVKKHSETFIYRVVLLNDAKAIAASKTVILQFVDLPAPPMPRDLKVEWVKLKDQAYIKLTWAKKAADDQVSEAYVLFSDQTSPGELVWVSHVEATKRNEFLYPVDNVKDAVMTVGVAGQSKDRVKGEIASVTIELPGRNMPTVEAVARQVSWKYPEVSHLLGFRVLADDKVIADEKSVDAKARRYEVPSTVPERVAISLIAVSRHGMESSKTIGKRFEISEVKPSSTADRTVGALTAKRSTRDGKPVVELNWTPPAAGAAHYAISVSGNNLGALKAIVSAQNVQGTSYAHEVSDPKQTLCFSVSAVDSSGQRQRAADVTILGEGRDLLPPTARSAAKVDATHCKVAWLYEKAPNLKGFRVYLKDQLVADEKTLGPDTRDATVELSAPGRYAYRVQAISIAGVESEFSGYVLYTQN